MTGGVVTWHRLARRNLVSYAILILAGILVIGLLPPLLMHRLRRPAWKAGGAAQSS